MPMHVNLIRSSFLEEFCVGLMITDQNIRTFGVSKWQIDKEYMGLFGLVIQCLKTKLGPLGLLIQC